METGNAIDREACKAALHSLFEAGAHSGQICDSPWSGDSEFFAARLPSCPPRIYNHESAGVGYFIHSVKCASLDPLRFEWESALQPMNIEGYYVRANGSADSLEGAARAALDHQFESMIVENRSWDRGQEYHLRLDIWSTCFSPGIFGEVKSRKSSDGDNVWTWERQVPPEALNLVKLCGGSDRLTGHALTAVDAMRAANNAYGELLAIAAELVGGDAFELGRDAALRDLRQYIAKF